MHFQGRLFFQKLFYIPSEKGVLLKERICSPFTVDDLSEWIWDLESKTQKVYPLQKWR